MVQVTGQIVADFTNASLELLYRNEQVPSLLGNVEESLRCIINMKHSKANFINIGILFNIATVLYSW